MSFFSKGDFKTREEWLKRQKKAALKKEEDKFNKNVKLNLPVRPSSSQKKEKLSQIVTLDTQHSACTQKLPLKQQEYSKLFKNQADAALYSSMQSRLLQQQHLRDKQRSQLNELNKLIQQARTENAIIKGVNSEIPSFNQAEQIILTNKQLAKQFQQMEAYLNSHGAFFEGDTIVGEFNVTKVKNDIKEAKTNYRTPSSFQFTAIEQRVQELNENLMKEMGSKRIVNAQGVAKFKECEQIKVSFFKNGVKFQTTSFYEYSSKDGLKILEDLTDGYYPHVLKKPFPDGVYMNIENRICEFWKQCEQMGPPKQDWFFGRGHSLGAE